MILFVPGYDSPTRANLKIARLLNTPKCIILFEETATREKLIAVLRISERPLFVMSHGIACAFKSQPSLSESKNNKNIQKQIEENIAFSQEDIILLKQRTVYVFACHTAQQLGKIAADFDSIWWGYSDTVACAFDNPNSEITGIFIDIFDFIRDNFSKSIYPKDIQAILEEIKRKCDDAAEAIDRIDREEELKDIFEIHATLRHIWDRLRVWLPGNKEPEKHPHSSSPSLPW